MSKLLSSVLDKISENNNDYRKELRTLNSLIDERTTSLVGELVTLSNYTIDFSNSISSAKEKLVNPISRIVEQYVIKDLRSVETVNEQFVEKINDKIENADLKSRDDKNAFVASLDNLLNDKYLEIVKIKRVPFLNESLVNDQVEGCVTDFINEINTNNTLDNANIQNSIATYKNELYDMIGTALANINKLYLNNFVDEISSSLNGVVDYEEAPVVNDVINNSVVEEPTIPFKPFIPEMNPVENIDIPASSNIIPEPVVNVAEPIVTPEINIQEEIKPSADFATNISDLASDVTLNEEPTQNLVEEEKQVEIPKKSYDVEEILKIAKSPVVTMEKKEEKVSDYKAVEPIIEQKELNPSIEFNEKEIVEEMIRRLTKRLEEINSKEAKLEEEEKQVEEDELFVNDLIDSSNNKKKELDSFEQELDTKDSELNKKEQELKEKINSIMPFANAVMENDK